MQADELAAHAHSSNHRGELEAGRVCGCFYCSSIYPPTSIDEWIGEEDGADATALCPRCGIDSVIGERSGYPITRAFLERMHKHWFGSR